MPSIRTALTGAISLSGLSTQLPETVVFSSPISGAQYLSDFSGKTSTLDFPTALTASGGVLIPLTVFSAPDGLVTCDWIKQQVARYEQVDDVFDASFLKGVYLKGSTSYESNLAVCLADVYGTEALFGNFAGNGVTAVQGANIANGPYVTYLKDDGAVLAPSYRIYQDENMAFMNGLLPSASNDSYKYSPANTASDSTIGIPVSSRLQASQDSANNTKPLAGIRVTVKDIIDVNGVKTSQGNRAWFNLYRAKNASAPGIQRLINLGASIIGKTKTAQFANADRPTADWVDYHDAFNPRGDGYQDPGVSSAGAGAATASYDWVDVSIGTDTGGSIRIPAGKNGVYGLRPSFGVISNEGVMPEGEYFDAVGYHARSPYTLQSFGKSWFSNVPQLMANHTRFPRRIIVPSNLWPVANNASQAVFDSWTSKLATFLNASVETTSISEFWNATANKPGTDFASYMQMVGFNLIWKNQLDKVITPFRKDYAAANGGRQPFINPFPAARYETAENVTEEDVSIAYDRFTFFKEWFGKEVVRADPESCSESLFLIPMATGDPSYRNSVYSPVNVSSWASFTPYYYSVQSQGPEVVFPIGEVPYNSTISGVEEKLPVAVDLLAHRHCDLMLLDLAAALADEGLLKEIKTGRTLW